MRDSVDLAEKLASFEEHFQPKIVGYYNDDKILRHPSCSSGAERRT